MNTITSLSKEALIQNLKTLVREERRITLEVLHNLREVERRRLHLEMGFPSLFEYVTRELGYSDGAAYRRISAMRAIRDLPELEPAIETGSLTVSTVSQVQTFLRAEKTQKKKTYTPEEKRELFESVQNLSSREVERKLAARSPETARPERERTLDGDHTEIRFVADAALLAKLKHARDLCAHRLKDPNSYAELLSVLSDLAIERLDPRKRAERVARGREVQPLAAHSRALPTPEPAKPSRYIPEEVRRQIWREANGRCTYRDKTTGHICGSTFKLQIEHLDPYSMGGSSEDPENLTLLCAAHNQLKAARVFGTRL